MIPQYKDKSIVNLMFNHQKEKRYHPYEKEMFLNNNPLSNSLFFNNNSFNNMNHHPSNQLFMTSYSLSNVNVWLENHLLWNQFHLFGNEMIITKPGRRMFPVLAFSVFGLNPSYYYKMEAEITPADNNRYKYVSVTGWRVNGVASKQEGNKKMYHPDGLQLGDYWQRNGVVFKRIKLTNKKTQKEGSNQIVVNSMHKYEIKLNISSFNENQEFVEFREVPFKETQFIAVTAYQNDDVTQLKIDHNPFAKAFRDSISPDIDGNYDPMFYGQMTSPQYNTQTDQMKLNSNTNFHQKDNNDFSFPFHSRFLGNAYFPCDNNTRVGTPGQWNVIDSTNQRMFTETNFIDESAKKSLSNFAYTTTHWSTTNTISTDLNNNLSRNDQDQSNLNSFLKSFDKNVFS